MGRWASGLAILALLALGVYWSQRDTSALDTPDLVSSPVEPIEQKDRTAAPSPERFTASAADAEIATEEPETNEQLALAQFYRDDLGKAVMITDRALKFSKRFEFDDGTVIEIPFSYEPVGVDDIDVAVEDYSLEDFDELVDQMTEGNWEVLAWAERKTAQCRRQGEIREVESQCGGYQEGMESIVNDIMWLLADSGDPRALRWRMKENYFRSDNDIELKDAQALWEQGYLEGLMRTMSITRDPSLLDYDSREDLYAKSYAMFAVMHAYMDGLPREILNGDAQDMWRQFDVMFSGFGAAARERAAQQAREILESNDKCCVVPIFRSFD
ncbi:MAG: hypothetical protein AAGL69_03210 [Pseudomonadota bacterium]